MLTQFFPEEKRQSLRLPSVELKAQFKSKQGLFATWLDLDVLDFSPFGIGLKLGSEPELGNKFTLKLLLDLEMGGNLSIPQIEAKIVNKVKLEGSDEWRVGLVFSSQSKQDQEIDLQLKRMFQLLERNEAIRERIMMQRVG